MEAKVVVLTDKTTKERFKVTIPKGDGAARAIAKAFGKTPLAFFIRDTTLDVEESIDDFGDMYNRVVEGQSYDVRLEGEKGGEKVYVEEQFIKLLQQGGMPQSSINKIVLENLAVRFTNQMEIVNRLNSPGAAIKLYDDIKNLPGTSTKLVINEKLGLSINGPWNQQALGSIILTATEDGFPLLLKQVSDNDEIVSVKAIDHQKLDINVPLVPCTVISTSIPNYSDEWTCLKMPTFIATVEMLAQLSHRALVAGGSRIVTAIEILHSKNPPIFHMDVKPANIFVDMEGRWYLGDFGSCIIGPDKKIKSTTRKFLPKGFSTNVNASPQFDYFMLLTSLAWLANKVNVTAIMDPTNQVDMAKLQIWIATVEDNELKTLLLLIKEKSFMFFN